jgi:hypothetical protein
MRQKLKNSIRLQPETSLQLWATSKDNRDINRACDNIREINMSALESLGYCESSLIMV